jgi:hypothetical protein
VPLRDIEEYHRWIERESPSVAAQRVARHFLAEVGDEAWRAPSVPIAELSNQPEYQVRVAAIDVPSEDPVRIWYRHIYANDAVDVIAVTSRDANP